MSRAGRNDPCPCGSGAKYKRCCLDSDASAVRDPNAAVAALDRLAKLAWDAYPDDCEAGFASYYAGGLPAFGLRGPTAEELQRAEAWLLLDRRLGIGATPLQCLAERLPVRGAELLAASSLRLWQIDWPGDGTVARGRCPLSGEAVAITTAPARGLRASRGLVVARTIALGEARAGLFAIVDVNPEVEDELVAWARQAWDRCQDPTGFWRSFGGELSRAASAWPEERHHTRDGDLIRSAMSIWTIRDPERAAECLADDPDMAEQPPEEVEYEGERSWLWRPAAAQPPATLDSSPGVRWILDEDEAGDRPRLARLDVDPYEERLWIFASTPQRLSAAEQRAGARLGRALRRRVERTEDEPDVQPRWQRQRFDRFAQGPAELAPPLNRAA